MKLELVRSGLSTLGLGLHTGLCPAHGILLKGGLVSSGGLLGQASEYVHRKEVEGIDYLLQKVDPQPKMFGYHRLQEQPKHPLADPIATGIDYTLLGLSTYIFGKAIYKGVKNFKKGVENNYKTLTNNTIKEAYQK